MRVSLRPIESLGDAASMVDAVVYLRKYGNHLLAVKVVNWRKGRGKLEDFFDELEDVVIGNDDQLWNYN